MEITNAGKIVLHQENIKQLKKLKNSLYFLLLINQKYYPAAIERIPHTLGQEVTTTKGDSLNDEIKSINSKWNEIITSCIEQENLNIQELTK
jgi:hypothetical protein